MLTDTPKLAVTGARLEVFSVESDHFTSMNGEYIVFVSLPKNFKFIDAEGFNSSDVKRIIPSFGMHPHIHALHIEVISIDMSDDA
jgi:hypothetical protein